MSNARPTLDCSSAFDPSIAAVSDMETGRWRRGSLEARVLSRSRYRLGAVISVSPPLETRNRHVDGLRKRRPDSTCGCDGGRC